MTHSLTRSVAALGAALTLGITGTGQAQSLAGQLTPETEVRLHLVDRLRSGTSKQGDRINFRVDEDVKDAAGNVLIRGGAPAYGTVVQSRGSHGWGGRGRLTFSVDYTTAVDGQRVPLRGSKEKAGSSSSTGAVVVATTLSLLGGFFIKGSNVTIEPGTPLVAFVDGVISVHSEAGAVIAGPGPAAAGPFMTFVLRNGDKLTGSVESMVNGVYTVVTRNGTLRIGAAEIQEIRDAVAGRVIATRSGQPERLGQ
jgi:hypothetical protein